MTKPKRRHKKNTENYYRDNPVVDLTIFLGSLRMGNLSKAETYRQKLAERGIVINPEKLEL